MEKKQFQAESKRLLEMMIHSIYTKHEIFLRELISNASDAIDKLYYKALTDESMTFHADDYFIEISIDEPNRLLTIRDTGIGMTKQEMEDNLGVIAQSGSLAFKKQVAQQEGHALIGQFGVGFYSAFMVADEITVVSQAYGTDVAHRWHSTGADGYTIEPVDAVGVGTSVTLKIRLDTYETAVEQKDESLAYEDYLHAGRIKHIVRKYSDFIRYPIKLDGETINTMVPIWRKNKSELTDDTYMQFYKDKHYGHDVPVRYVHVQADGAVRYQAILYIPSETPFNYFTKDFERGLELYASGVLIMEKCATLLPEHFGFVKGMVDSEDLSLNISREMLQHDRQLLVIARNIKNKIKSNLESLLKDDREKYEQFFKAFGRPLKFGAYNEFGAHKADVQDLLLFYSSTESKLVTLAEYVERMREGQKYIYYATGSSHDRIAKMPQIEALREKGIEMVYLTDDVDEFALKMMRSYADKEFRSISSGDLGLDELLGAQQDTPEQQHDDVFDAVKKVLGDAVHSVRPSQRLRAHPVCLTSEGELTIEMEKVLNNVPNRAPVEAKKVLEVNVQHDVFRALKQAFDADEAKFALYARLLYQQALLIEGLPLEDPVAFSNDVCLVMT
ncbi:MAG: molecular chaperone HtpG [Paenibacillaceae bacterium]|nr:molecular chaperone HtpG [Paenibacillaceae bacterium]